MEILQHDISNQTLEYASARHEHAWVRNLWFESDNRADCIYCRLFERPVD